MSEAGEHTIPVPEVCRLSPVNHGWRLLPGLSFPGTLTRCTGGNGAAEQQKVLRAGNKAPAVGNEASQH